ncbi:MAG: ROK family protein [Candidatus Zixiibacteriota bacterium]|nr:MAG: ROK family protein [candidate division Zixibacteria bacterium]
MKKVYAGIDLGGTFIKAGLISPGGARISYFKIPTEVESGLNTVRDNLIKAGKRLISISGRKRMKLCGIGIGSPGTVRYPEGIVTDSSPNIPGWVGTSFGGLSADLKIEVRADNDANCMALGEYMFGAGRGTRSGFYITIGTGIGGAFIYNGRLIRGASYAAGEFGHTALKYNGKKCKCGRRGCVEAYTAVPALIQSAKKLAKKHPYSSLRKKLDGLTSHMIFDAFKKGDRAASEAVRLNAAMLGSAVGSVVNLFNPEIVVVGGGLAEAGKKYIDELRKNIIAFAFGSAANSLKIRSARLGNSAGWIGAACLNFDKNNR